MLGGISKGRHVAVATAIGGITALTGFGVIGGGHHPERFDSWLTIVEPAGGDGVRVTEIFDQDFGSNTRHGPLRVIPTDFGTPQDIRATSPDAPADVTAIDRGPNLEIRIGDPDTDVTGQHRYTLSYVLPDARVSLGRLELDVLGGDEFDTTSASVVVRGFELTDIDCFIGGLGGSDRCELVDEGASYRADLGHLPPHTGVTLDAAVVGSAPFADVPEPPLPERRDDNPLPITLGVGAAGLATAGSIYRYAKRKGSNEVFAGGAADAALGFLPAPGGDAAPQPPTTIVSDDELARMATIEFAPPKGLQPWEAAVLLSESITGSQQDWLTGMAGIGAIEVADADGKLSIASGPKRGELPAADAALLNGILSIRDPYVTGTYDANFSAAWDAIGTAQRERITASGWWSKGGPGASMRGGLVWVLIALFVIGPFLIVGGIVVSATTHLLDRWPAALALAVVASALVAWSAYGRLLASRTAQGSALALQAESFRRFLAASEGKHVEWAWEHGILREYSAWAVALGEAAAWNKALDAANVPPAAKLPMGPIIVAGHSGSISSSHTKPSSSGSSGGGFSGGGSVGGGGGGGSRGSW